MLCLVIGKSVPPAPQVLTGSQHCRIDNNLVSLHPEWIGKSSFVFAVPVADRLCPCVPCTTGASDWIDRHAGLQSLELNPCHYCAGNLPCASDVPRYCKLANVAVSLG